jgi:hypothetical protein
MQKSGTMALINVATIVTKFPQIKLRFSLVMIRQYGVVS